MPPSVPKDLEKKQNPEFYTWYRYRDKIQRHRDTELAECTPVVIATAGDARVADREHVSALPGGAVPAWKHLAQGASL